MKTSKTSRITPVTMYRLSNGKLMDDEYEAKKEQERLDITKDLEKLWGSMVGVHTDSEDGEYYSEQTLFEALVRYKEDFISVLQGKGFLRQENIIDPNID